MSDIAEKLIKTLGEKQVVADETKRRITLEKFEIFFSETEEYRFENCVVCFHEGKNEIRYVYPTYVTSLRGPLARDIDKITEEAKKFLNRILREKTV